MAITTRQLGAALRRRRLELGEKQAVIARRARLAESTLSRLERGQRLGGLGPLLRVADALDLDVQLVPPAGEPIVVRDELTAELVALVGAVVDEQDRSMALPVVRMLRESIQSRRGAGRPFDRRRVSRPSKAVGEQGTGGTTSTNLLDPSRSGSST